MGNDLKTAAHCATPFLHVDGSWLYAQIAGLKRYRSVVLTQEAQNLDEFPVEVLHTAEDYAAPQRWLNRIGRKIAGEYPFYAGLLRREGAVLIHAHFGYQGCRCLRARRTSGLPMVTSFYGADATSYPRHEKWRRHYQRLFAAGELFLVEGNTLKAGLAELGCPAEKIRVHQLGVDVERITFRARRPSDKVRFLICAPFREKKGIPYALEALGRVVRQGGLDCEIVLIGDGPERQKIEQTIERVGLVEQVQMRGFLPYSKVIEELAHCHILLQTSTTATDGDTEGGAPVILLDAQASGLPVVATRHADIPEYVCDGQSALLAPERDVEAIAHCLGQLLEAPERWAEMGAAGRRHVEQNYNAALQRQRLELIYDELLRDHSSEGCA